jgi:hypothetical protein
VSFRLRGGKPRGIIRGMSGRTTGPVFAGVHALLTMIRDLSARPRFFPKPTDQDLWGDRPLPLVCLRREAGPTGLLAALSEQLDWTVPHVLVDAAVAEERSRQRWDSQESQRRPPLLPLLDELSRELAKKSFGTKRLTRFDRYRLADWLTGHEVPPARGRDDRADMAQLLRRWIGGHDQPNLAPVVDAAPGWPAKLVMGFALWAWRKVGYRWATERVPGLGRETRWFMRQQFMVPRHSVGFLGFAERLKPRAVQSGLDCTQRPSTADRTAIESRAIRQKVTACGSQSAGSAGGISTVLVTSTGCPRAMDSSAASRASRT